MYQRRNPKTGKREGNWYISVGGVRTSSGTSDRARAKAQEHKLNTEIWDRQNGFVSQKWEAAVVAWAGDNPGPAGAESVKRFLAFWKDHLTGKKLPEITPKLVHGIVEQHFEVDLENPVQQNSTANNYVSIVPRVIRHGSSLNPKLITYPKPRGRDRWLSVPEWVLFSGKAPADFLDICTFALATGLREANDMDFRWAWLKDGDTWAMIPPEFTKTAKPYAIPLNRTAQAVIRRRRAAVVQHPELVFLNAGKPWYAMSLCRVMQATVKAAAIDKITFHGFRHTFATWLAQKGVDEAIRARLGCWAHSTQTGHYSHFNVESLRPFSEKIDEMLVVTQSSYTQSTA